MTDKLRIRMYNVGFGDCFLIGLPDRRAILVDAGYHSQGRGKFSGGELAQQVIADAEEWTGAKRVDVVVATHRHQDHITTFNSADWDELSVGEVWLPWVEDPENAAARKMWKKKQAFAETLAAALPSFHLADDDKAAADFMLWNAGVGPPLFPGWSNAGALERLHGGFARRDRDKPRFLPRGEEFPETFETKALPGVKIHVLGPPRDPGLIGELDPEQDGESYRAIALRAKESTNALLSPFEPAWVVDDAASQGAAPLDTEEIERLRDLARTADPLFAARALDDMINATSLVLVLQVGSARLLLPGDAEWGTWKVILEDKTARSLLRNTTFFKVGHHGSHNGTPKTLVEEILPAKVKAMVSTQEGDGNYRNNIPLPDLLSALEAHGVHAVRSDRDDPLPRGFVADEDQLWIDLELPC
ncbi:MAG: MBL fold metallo-hydrolase [Myxococcales bacterium]|nr:MBL fold metallo-hydrolase [Myxococcales bacterium]